MFVEPCYALVTMLVLFTPSPVCLNSDALSDRHVSDCACSGEEKAGEPRFVALYVLLGTGMHF